jgi:tetratricopeptide (TPR) repeat protein
MAGMDDPGAAAHGLFLLAELRRAQGDLGGALNAASRAVRTRHNEWAYHALRLAGLILADLGQLGEAEAQLGHLATLGHPEASVRAVDDLAAVMLKAGRADQAEQRLRELTAGEEAAVAVAAVTRLGRLLADRHGVQAALGALSELAARHLHGTRARGVADAGAATFLLRDLGDREQARRAAQAALTSTDEEVRGLAERLLAGLG